MKSKVAVPIAIAGVLLIAATIYILSKASVFDKSIYEINWRIDLPSDYKVIYQMQDDHGFRGDGNRYTILQLTGDNSFPLRYEKYEETDDMQEVEGNSTDGNYSEIESFVDEIIAKLNIPQEYRPVYFNRYSWQKFVKHKSDILVILYFLELKRMYFIEKLI